MKTDLTIHAVVKNEPFIYYAIKAVYNYCDEILLYDTGSTDKYTLKDIATLLAEDTDKKIIFKQIPLDFDEEKWSLVGLEDFIAQNKGKMSVGKCRQMQIDETKTKYFMLVDGDEVHYRRTMEYIIYTLIPNWPKNKVCVGLPLNWFYDLDHTFTSHTFPVNGRIMITDKVYMNDDSPNEQHIIKGTTDVFTYEHPAYYVCPNVKPYAHFESVIRPWRRKHLVPANNIKVFSDTYPEVIYENSTYMARWMNEQ